MTEAIPIILVLVICYSFYRLLADGKPLNHSKRKPTQQMIDEFNQRYKEGFYNERK